MTSSAKPPGRHHFLAYALLSEVRAALDTAGSTLDRLGTLNAWPEVLDTIDYHLRTARQHVDALFDTPSKRAH